MENWVVTIQTLGFSEELRAELLPIYGSKPGQILASLERTPAAQIQGFWVLFQAQTDN